ncbi:hypothetical protein J8Z83_22390, partial [Yersinia enterocolitica]|uniref:hypothetical protein n=1 Tax=Yersinia enterocolitica TaxID=630 RepID=UPI001C8F1B4D
SCTALNRLCFKQSAFCGGFRSSLSFDCLNFTRFTFIADGQYTEKTTNIDGQRFYAQLSANE